MIWEEFDARLAPAGATVKTGKIFKKDVLSSAASSASRCSTASCGWPATPRTPSRRLVPRGSIWLRPNVRIFDRALGAYYDAMDTGLLELFTQTALPRVWRGQWFTWWMT